MNLTRHFDARVEQLSELLAGRFKVEVNHGEYEDESYFRELQIANSERDLDLLVWDKGDAELIYYLNGWMAGESYELVDDVKLGLIFGHLAVILEATSVFYFEFLQGSRGQRWQGSEIPGVASG